MRKRRWDWRFAGAIASAILLVWVVAEILAAGKGAPPPPGEQPISLRGGHFAANRISTKSWTFEYRKAQLSADGSLATVDGLRRGTLYNNGKPYMGITAEHVSANIQTLDFTATGDVHIEQLNPKDGIKRTFDTDFVKWINDQKLLTLAHPSLVQTGDQKLTVASIKVNFDTDQVHFGKIKGGFIPP